MVNALLRAVLDHHIWANDTLVAFCETLEPEALALTVPGTYGTVHRTLAHLAEGEQVYLSRIPETGIAITLDDEAEPLPTIAAIRAALRATGAAWHEVAARWPDDLQLRWRRRDGSEEEGSVSFSIVQMLDHGGEHRGQVRTILGAHGIVPPEIDGWTWDAYRREAV